MVKIIRKCKICKKEFETREEYKVYTCSKKCSTVFRSGKNNPNYQGAYIIKTCPICGKQFSSFKSINQKSCGKNCGNKLKSINASKTNLGKTKYTHKHLMKMSKERTGVKRSKEIRKKVSLGVSKWLQEHNFESKYIYKNIKMRSNWEVLFATWLDNKKFHWEYEPKRFYLKNQNSHYLPDFYVKEWKSFVEVKGYMGERSKKKIDEFCISHNLIIIDEKEMKKRGLI